ncbi:MAG TPA: nucleotidyltransferase domain-containing protein [Planctomycetota bacterium]|nr:nucleotidyltransferase domain-containing protein [Planctomycetota bacterium]
MSDTGAAFGIDEKLIHEIVRRILSVARPDKIILFGSAATRKMTRDSDVDLLVVEPDPSDPRAESVRIQEALLGLHYPFDVIVISTERFEESKMVIGGIAYPANKYGKVVYEAA